MAKRKRKNEFEEILQGILAIFLLGVMGATLYPVLVSAGATAAIPILITFYASIFFLTVTLVIKFLEILKIKL